MKSSVIDEGDLVRHLIRPTNRLGLGIVIDNRLVENGIRDWSDSIRVYWFQTRELCLMPTYELSRVDK